MTTLQKLLLCLAVSLGSASSLFAAEPQLEFVSALRERKYFDTAIEYLNTITDQPNLSEEVRQRLPYEKARTYLMLAQEQKSADKILESLTQAEGFLAQFLKESPRHELAGDAGTSLGNVLLQKGKTAILQADQPINQAKRNDYLAEARSFFSKAREIFQKANDRHEAEWKAFGAFIDQTTEPERYAQRSEAEQKFISDQLSLAMIQFEQAHTYELNSDKFKEELNLANKMFELMFDKYRTQIGGLIARLYQGKCFEEQGDIQKALGFYNDLLGYPGESVDLSKLKDQAMHFRLICLARRNDFQLVVIESQEWMKTYPRRSRSRTGIAIQWEQAKALESLANSAETPVPQKAPLYREANTIATEVSRLSFDYRAAAQSMLNRIRLALDKGTGDPTSFENAFALGKQMAEKIPQMRTQREAAPPRSPERNKLDQEYQTHLNEAVRMLRLALNLAREETAVKELNRTRFLLAYTLYLQGNSYDAAVLGEFVARRYAHMEQLGNQPLEAAWIAMAAYEQAFRDKTNTNPDVDIAHLIDLCDHVTTVWPQSDKAVEARLLLGQLYTRIKKYPEAAKWYMEVPESSDKYLSAQLSAGRSYWVSYLISATSPEGQRPAKEVIEEYRQKARQILDEAIAKTESRLPETGPIPEDLALSKFTLSQITNSMGDFQRTLDLLVSGKLPVIPATVVAEGEKRPEQGIQSRVVASDAHQQLLRAYIGLQNLDEAREAMKALEEIESAAGQQVTSLYVELGKQIRQELERLDKTDPERYGQVLESFETFLQNMLDRPEAQNFNSLIWIAETYLGLGEGTTDKARGQGYFDRSISALQQALNKGEAESIPVQNLLAAKYRMVAAKRHGGRFEEALELANEILKSRPTSIEVQFEAAQLLLAWGKAEPEQAKKRLEQAINGIDGRKEGGIWGFNELAARLDRQLEIEFKQEYLNQYYEARLHVAESRHEAGVSQNADNKRKELLSMAERDINYTILTREVPDEWYEKFNNLYRENLEAQGKPVVDLSRRVSRTVVAENEPDKKQNLTNPEKSEEKTEEAAEAQGTNWTLILFGIVVSLGGVGVAWMLFGQKKSRPKVSATTSFPLVVETKTRPSPTASTSSTEKPRRRPKP